MHTTSILDRRYPDDEKYSTFIRYLAIDTTWLNLLVIVQQMPAHSHGFNIIVYFDTLYVSAIVYFDPFRKCPTRPNVTNNLCPQGYWQCIKNPLIYDRKAIYMIPSVSPDHTPPPNLPLSFGIKKGRKVTFSIQQKHLASQTANSRSTERKGTNFA